MGRIRTIKPEFWSHEDLSELPPETHMLAAALLNYADDEGYFNANPRLVAAACCPLRDDSTNVRRSLDLLQSVGFVELYEGSDGKQYGHVVNFLKHQRVDRPKPSKIKDLCDSTMNRRNVDDESTEEGNREQGTGKGTGNREQGNKPVSREARDDVLSVFEHWRSIMNHEKAKLDDKRSKLIRKSLALGYTVDDLHQAITGYSLSPFHMGENENGRRYDGLELILRNADKIDAGIEFYRSPPRMKGRQARTEAINQQAMDEFLRGDDPFGFDDGRDTVIEGEWEGGTHD